MSELKEHNIRQRGITQIKKKENMPVIGHFEQTSENEKMNINRN